MTQLHNSDCDPRCVGDWCTCLCHQPTERLRSEGLAASGDLARTLLALDRDGVEVPTEVLRAQQTVARYLDALEGAPGGEAIEEP
jgi:hypothetical protein